MASNSIDALPREVAELLKSEQLDAGLGDLLGELLSSFRSIGDALRSSESGTASIGTHNDFGDEQLDVDVKSDALMFAALRRAGTVHIAASEENPVETECGGTGSGFSVAFDPLDGSSIVDVNMAVGTIVGVWPGRGLKLRTGREQCAAIVAQYGPKVTVALAISGAAAASGEAAAMELTMHVDHWVVSIPKLEIKAKANTFAPGNLRATCDNAKYNELVQFYIQNKYTLRYSGGLVPDVYHILIKKQGILTNVSSPSAKAKLRLLFECAPIALIVEAAGGQSCVCASEANEAVAPISLLDVVADEMDKRVGVCYGSSAEVDRCKEYLFRG
jgi:sedoheptulose-bisphosphatase